MLSLLVDEPPSTFAWVNEGKIGADFAHEGGPSSPQREKSL
jgi:hypothetical protein